MPHEETTTRRDVYAELIHHTTLRRAMNFRRVSIRQLAAQASAATDPPVALSHQYLGHLCTGLKTQCSPEAARAIETALELEPGSLFEMKVRYAAARARRGSIAVSEADKEDVA